MTALIDEKLLTLKRLAPKTILVHEGSISDEMIFIIKDVSGPGTMLKGKIYIAILL